MTKSILCALFLLLSWSAWADDSYRDVAIHAQASLYADCLMYHSAEGLPCTDGWKVRIDKCTTALIHAPERQSLEERLRTYMVCYRWETGEAAPAKWWLACQNGMQTGVTWFLDGTIAKTVCNPNLWVSDKPVPALMTAEDASAVRKQRIRDADHYRYPGTTVKIDPNPWQPLR